MSNTKNNTRFIVVEGIDGSGKSTIVDYIVKKLENANFTVSKGRGLGTAKVAETIRSQMFSKKPSSNYEVFAAIMCLIDCHENFVKDRIENSNDIVVLDRYIPSYYAYQVSGRNSSIARKMLLEAFDSTYKPTPDIYIYIDVDLDVALSRTKNRGDSNYLDEETSRFRSRVDAGYKEFFDKIDIMDISSLDSGSNIDIVPPFVIKLNGNNSVEEVMKELDSKFDSYTGV